MGIHLPWYSARETGAERQWIKLDIAPHKLPEENKKR
jgi:hypothetical protein